MGIDLSILQGHFNLWISYKVQVSKYKESKVFSWYLCRLMVLDKFPKMRQMAPQKMAFPIFLDYWFLYKKQDKQTVSLFVFNEADPWQLSFSQTARGSPEAAKFCTTATYSLGWGNTC